MTQRLLPLYNYDGYWLLYKDLVIGKYDLITDLPACLRNKHCLFIPHSLLIKSSTKKFQLIRYNGVNYDYYRVNDIQDMREIVTKDLLKIIDSIYIGTLK